MNKHSKNGFFCLSDSIAKSFERLFKAGGFALAFGFGGLLLIVLANFSYGDLQGPTFCFGCLLTLICVIFFVITSFRELQFNNETHRVRQQRVDSSSKSRSHKTRLL